MIALPRRELLFEVRQQVGTALSNFSAGAVGSHLGDHLLHQVLDLLFQFLVREGREPLRLEAPHLTRRSRAPLRRFAADNPAHRRIMAQALGVVHILVSGKATKYRLPEQPGQCVPTILASARIGQHITRHHGQADCVVEFAIGEQPRSEAAIMNPTVKAEPNSIRVRVTRRVMLQFRGSVATSYHVSPDIFVLRAPTRGISTPNEPPTNPR